MYGFKSVNCDDPERCSEFIQFYIAEALITVDFIFRFIVD